MEGGLIRDESRADSCVCAGMRLNFGIGRAMAGGRLLTSGGAKPGWAGVGVGSK